jgi:hypothetical protein
VTRIVEGRPDFTDHSFGKTYAKKFPKYVFSNMNGLLIHVISSVEFHWYDARGSYLERRDTPRVIINTNCNQTFFGHSTTLSSGKPRASFCELPKADAVLCGRCHGQGPIFGRDSKSTVTKQEAKARLGCAVSAEENAD